MSFNGNGVFLRVRNWVNDAASNIPILANRHDSEDDNFAQGLTQCITRDGQTTITANLPMAGFKHTDVGSATAGNQYAALSQVQASAANWAVAGGTADAITAVYTPNITTLVDGQQFNLRVTTPNATSTPTFSPDGFTARTIVKNNNVPLAVGELIGDIILRYDLPNTRYELVTTKGITELTGDVTASGTRSVAATIPAGTINTARMGGDVTAYAKTLLVAANASTAQTTLGGTTVGKALFTATGQAAALATLGVGKRLLATYTDVLNTATAVSAIIPADNTIPQRTEGTELLTIAVTPASTSSRLRIRFNAFGSPVTAPASCFALFTSASLNAIFAAGGSNGAGFIVNVSGEVDFFPASVSPINISLRAGPTAAGSVRINANNAGARLFGTATMTTMTIEEFDS